MLVISIVAALTKLKTEAEEFKMTVLYQQCLNRLGKYSETSITEEELGEIPGFSEYVINEIKQKATDKRKAKDDENTDSRKKLKENENQVFKRTKPIQSLRSGDLKCKECLKDQISANSVKDGPVSSPAHCLPHHNPTLSS